MCHGLADKGMFGHRLDSIPEVFPSLTDPVITTNKELGQLIMQIFTSNQCGSSNHTYFSDTTCSNQCSKVALCVQSQALESVVQNQPSLAGHYDG